MSWSLERIQGDQAWWSMGGWPVDQWRSWCSSGRWCVRDRTRSVRVVPWKTTRCSPTQWWRRVPWRQECRGRCSGQKSSPWYFGTWEKRIIDRLIFLFLLRAHETILFPELIYFQNNFTFVLWIEVGFLNKKWLSRGGWQWRRWERADELPWSSLGTPPATTPSSEAHLLASVWLPLSNILLPEIKWLLCEALLSFRKPILLLHTL